MPYGEAIRKYSTKDPLSRNRNCLSLRWTQPHETRSKTNAILHNILAMNTPFVKLLFALQANANFSTLHFSISVGSYQDASSLQLPVISFEQNR